MGNNGVYQKSVKQKRKLSSSEGVEMFENSHYVWGKILPNLVKRHEEVVRSKYLMISHLVDIIFG